MSTVRPLTPARHPRFAALPAPAAAPRLPGKPRLDSLGPSLWLTRTLRRTVWRWQRRATPRTPASLVWC